MNALQIKATRFPIQAVFFGLGYLMVAGYVLSGQYFVSDPLSWLALLVSPYLFILNTEAKGSFRYLILSVLCLGTSVFVHLHSLYFLAVAFALFFAIEAFAGKLNRLLLLWIAVISPVFRHLSVVFGFPIRLWLSVVAGKLLGWMGFKAEVLGNVIQLNGTEFSVDPACMGLQMLTASCLSGLLTLAFFERKTGKSLSFLMLILVFAGIILLNIGCNLVRIVLLVLFKILPKNPLHEILGLVCLAVYGILPAYFLIKLVYEQSAKGWQPAFLWRCLPFSWLKTLFPAQAVRQQTNFHKHLIFNSLLLAMTAAQGILFRQTAPEVQSQAVSCRLPGFRKELLKNGIVKLENEGCLVYVKPLAGFYSAEHSPLICWQGSGYVFSQTATRTLAGTEIYWGILKKDKDKIYTAWWFDNGNFRTIHPLDWRLNTLKKGVPFSLVNVNATSEAGLLESVTNIMKEKIFENSP